MLTYGYDTTGTVYLTGARYSAIASLMIRESFESECGRWASLNAADVSLVHAFWEASQSDPEYGHFMAHLSPGMRARAVSLGMML